MRFWLNAGAMMFPRAVRAAAFVMPSARFGWNCEFSELKSSMVILPEMGMVKLLVVVSRCDNLALKRDFNIVLIFSCLV